LRKKQFATRVQLYGSNNRFLGNVPANEAERLHVTGGAAIHDQRGHTVRAIRLSNPIGNPRKPPSPPSIHQYMGQHYTHREKIGGKEQFARLVQFNYIHPDDKPLFCLSVTDCLTGAKA
jgi:hypothetical protein